MTNYSDPLEKRFDVKIRNLAQRLATAEQLLANTTPGPAAGPSTSRPSNPYAGMPYYETDTGLSSLWNGASWIYPPQLVDSVTLGSTQASVGFPSGARPIPNVFTFLRLEWRVHLTTGGPTDLLMQVDSDTTAHYLWAKDEAVSGAAGNGHGGSAQTSIKIGAVGGSTANYFATGSLSIAGWHGGTGHLSVSGTSALFDTNSVDYVGAYGGLYAVPPPHTSLTIFPAANSFIAGSQLSLYGWT